MSPISPSTSFSHLHQISEQGLLASRKRVEAAALKTSQGDLSVKNSVDMQTHKRAFEINASVLKAHDQMTGKLLNVLA